MAENVMAQVFDTILSTPGMNEAVKIDLKISRKNVLLLNHVIERGLNPDGDKSPGLLANVSKENLHELEAIAEEYLVKADLKELSGKLKALTAK